MRRAGSTTEETVPEADVNCVLTTILGASGFGGEKHSKYSSESFFKWHPDLGQEIARHCKLERRK